MPAFRPDRLITLGLSQPLLRTWRWLRSSTGPRVLPILMYHSISEDPETATSAYYKVCTSPKRFNEHLHWLAAAGYRGVTLSEGLAWLNGSEKTGNTAVKLAAITFDDGFRDFDTAAFPALRQHGFAATMYLPTAFIGDERKTFKTRECLTWGEVNELHQAGMEFGSHTVNHPKLVELSWPEIEKELRDSKTTIEQRLQLPARHFAYPYAFPQANRQFAARFQQTLQAIGYETNVTTEIGIAQRATPPLRLPRLPANAADDQALLTAKLFGAYNGIGKLQLMAKTLKRVAKPSP